MGVSLNKMAKSDRKAGLHTEDQGFYFSHVRYKIKPKLF